jgi:hypothetical protein
MATRSSWRESGGSHSALPVAHDPHQCHQCTRGASDKGWVLSRVCCAQEGSRDDWVKVPGRNDPKPPITTVIMPSSPRERRNSSERMGGTRRASALRSRRWSHDEHVGTDRPLRRESSGRLDVEAALEPRTQRTPRTSLCTPRVSHDEWSPPKRAVPPLTQLLRDPAANRPTRCPSTEQMNGPSGENADPDQSGSQSSMQSSVSGAPTSPRRSVTMVRQPSPLSKTVYSAAVSDRGRASGRPSDDLPG